MRELVTRSVDYVFASEADKQELRQRVQQALTGVHAATHVTN